MLVILTFNDAYAPHAATIISEIIYFTKKPIDVAVLYYNLSNDNRSILRDFYEKKLNSLVFYEIEKEDLASFSDVKTAAHLQGVETFLRILSPMVLQQYDYALYLDCDTIVLDDLYKIVDESDKTKYLNAVKEYDIEHKFRRLDSLPPYLQPIENYMIRDSYFLRVQRKLGMESDIFRYFNAGVLFLNLEKMREDHIPQKLLKYISNNPILFSADQDAFNAILNCDFGVLKPKWNTAVLGKGVMTGYSEEDLAEAHECPGIIHITGNLKPWHYMCMHPMRKQYLNFRKLTPYGKCYEVDKNFRNILRKQYYVLRINTSQLFQRIKKRFFDKKTINMFATAYLEA